MEHACPKLKRCTLSIKPSCTDCEVAEVAKPHVLHGDPRNLRGRAVLWRRVADAAHLAVGGRGNSRQKSDTANHVPRKVKADNNLSL